jgi:branched-chain amino acid transport system substrate-binding protein
MKRLLRSFVVALALALLVGTLPARGAGEPFELQAVFPLSGPAAFVGRLEAQAMSAIERLVNNSGGIRGRPLRIVVQDDQSNPAVAVQIVQQLIAKNVSAFVGPSFGATCVAVLPLINNGPVMYCIANVIHPTRGSYAFSANPSTKDYTASALRYIKAKGARKLALLTSTDASGQDGEQVALENLRTPEFRDLRLVANEHFAVGDLTVSAQIARIKASGAEAIDAWTTGTPFGTVLRGVQEGSYDGWVISNAGNLSRTQMEQYASFIPQNLIFTATPSMAIGVVPARVRLARVEFLDSLHQVGIGTAEILHQVAWDPTLILVDAYRHLGTEATAAQIKDYIGKLHDFPGIFGFYDFRRGDQRGVDPLSGPVARWDKNAHEFITISKPGGMPF